MMVNDHLDFDELSVAESSYDDLPNNHQLSSLNIDDRESLPSEHDDDYDGINIGNNSPLHINNNTNNNNNNSNHQGAAESSTQQQDTNNKKTNLPLLSACYTAALTTGATTYAFSFYSNALKSSLHLSQNQLDTLSSAIFCAGILSWIPGMVVDSFGARFAMTVGGIGNMINLSCYWMIVTERWKIWNINVLIFVLSALGVFIFVGCALVTGSVFKVIVESCGKGTKGKAVGCAKGYVGVGSGVYVCLFSALFGSSGSGGAAGGEPATAALMAMLPSTTTLSSNSFVTSSDGVPQNPELNSLNFLIMAAVLSLLAAVLPALCLIPKQISRASPFKDRRDGTRRIHFRVIYAGLILLGVWVIGTSLAEIEEETIDNSRHNSGGDSSSVNPDSSIENKTDWDTDISLVADDGMSSVTTLWNFARRTLSSRSSSSSPERHWGAAFLLTMLWWGPPLSLLVIPPRKEGTDEGMIPDRNAQDCSYNDEDDNEINNEGDDEELEETFLQDEDIPVVRSRRYRKRPESEEKIDPERNYTMLEMLRTSSAWLMAWTCVIIVGGGTVMTNNIGQMTEALGFDADLTPASLALFSAAQAASRVITGAVSEAALSWKLPWFCGYLSSGSGGEGLARPAFLVVASIVSAAAHFSLAIATTEEGFALGVTLSGIAFGMVWPLMVLITGEVFGTLHVGANYMFFDGFSSAAGTLLLSKFVAQTVYDDHINENHGDAVDEDSYKCFGTACFQLSHLIVSALSLTCVFSSVGLIWTTKDVYRRS